MTCDTSSFRIMDLDSGDLSNLCPLNVEEAILVNMELIRRMRNVLDIMG